MAYSPYFFFNVFNMFVKKKVSSFALEQDGDGNVVIDLNGKARQDKQSILFSFLTNLDQMKAVEYCRP